MIPVQGAIETGTILVDKYRIESVIGRGGMGLVYRAHHLALGESVAVKILRRDVSRDEELVHRFVREAQSAVRLKSEHVARIQDVGTLEDGLPYMVMEFLEGADLGQLVDTNGAMHVPVAVDLVLQASDAICEAHSLGIVHRDIKPSNLFVSFRPDDTAIVKVLDFGISKSASGEDLSLTQTSSMLGTPAYMSPEQMRSARDVDARTDVWSLGTVLYELVEGRRPFDAESFSEMCVMVAVDPPAPMTLAPELEPIITKCLAKRADDRYANVAELMQDLAPFAGNPDAARHFITRAYRVLGHKVPRDYDSSPSIRPAVAPKKPIPALHVSTLMGSAATPPQTAVHAAIGASTPGTTISDQPRRPNRTVAVMLVLCVLVGVGGAIGYVKATEGDDQVATVPSNATERSGSDAIEGASNADDVASGTAGAGSNAVGTSASDVAAGSNAVGTSASDVAAGSNAAGSNAAGSNAGSGSGAGGRSTTIASTVAKPPRGGGKPSRGRGKPPRGGTGDAGKGAGSATAVPPPKKCDPFDSRVTCK